MYCYIDFWYTFHILSIISWISIWVLILMASLPNMAWKSDTVTFTLQRILEIWCQTDCALKFWISNCSSDVSPLYSIWTQKRSLKMFLNIFNTEPGTKKAICISGTPCTLWILSFRPHYKFSYLWNHPQPWLESQTPPHLHCGKFSKFEVKPVKWTIFEFQTVSSDNLSTLLHFEPKALCVL